MGRRAAGLRVAGLGLAAALAGCAAAPQRSGEAQGDPAAQEAACLGAVAAHVGRPEAEVSVAVRETTPEGVSVYEARDGTRLHLCEVDARARVLRLLHPGADA